jgi:hypothetical protein
MNHLWGTRFCVMATVLAVLAGLAPLAPSVRGGEPIIIPSDKSKTAPATPEKKPLPRDVFRFGERVTPPPSFEIPNLPIMPSTTPLDPREQKRRKLERLERENWMMVDEGELQEEEREKDSLGMRDYSLDGFEKDDARGNLMFRNSNKDSDSHQRLPGQPRSPLDKGRPRLLRPEEPEEEREQRDDSKQGAHISSQLDLKKMLEPREGDSLAPKFNKSDLTLQSLLNGGATPDALRDRQERREEFQRFLDRGSATAISGPSDPINQRTDFTRQPFNPTMPEPLGGSTPGSGGIFGLPTMARPGPAAGSLPNAFGSPAPRAGFSATPQITPPPESRGPAKPTLKFEPPRRKF